MPRPSYDDILNKLTECQRENGALSTDEEWNVITRKAIPFRLKRVAEGARFVVVVTITNTDEVSPGSIRRALNMRSAAVLLRARWNQEDALFVLSDDPHAFVNALKVIMRNEGIRSFTALAPYSGNIVFDHDRAATMNPGPVAQSLPVHEGDR